MALELKRDPLTLHSKSHMNTQRLLASFALLFISYALASDEYTGVPFSDNSKRYRIKAWGRRQKDAFTNHLDTYFPRPPTTDENPTPSRFSHHVKGMRDHAYEYGNHLKTTYKEHGLRGAAKDLTQDMGQKYMDSRFHGTLKGMKERMTVPYSHETSERDVTEVSRRARAQELFKDKANHLRDRYYGSKMHEGTKEFYSKLKRPFSSSSSSSSSDPFNESTNSFEAEVQRMKEKIKKYMAGPVYKQNEVVDAEGDAFYDALEEPVDSKRVKFKDSANYYKDRMKTRARDYSQKTREFFRSQLNNRRQRSEVAQ